MTSKVYEGYLVKNNERAGTFSVGAPSKVKAYQAIKESNPDCKVFIKIWRKPNSKE